MSESEYDSSDPMSESACDDSKRGGELPPDKDSAFAAFSSEITQSPLLRQYGIAKAKAALAKAKDEARAKALADEVAEMHCVLGSFHRESMTPACHSRMRSSASAVPYSLHSGH
jgi:hypothetical protein